MTKVKPSTELNYKIVSLYLSGLDTYQVAEECQCSQTFVMNTLKRCNIKRRTTQHYTTKYLTNEKFFDVINNEEKAYFLGLMYADGNNYVNKAHSYEISMSLQESDKLILEIFRNKISPNTQLKFKSFKNKNWKNQYLFKINSKVISNQLTKLGCMPNKSLKLKFPKLTNKDLISHFMRGYFDGDGSLYAKKPTKTGYVNWGWQITSTKSFCNSVAKILKRKFNIHCSQLLSCPKTNQITTTLSVGGNNQVMTLLDWLYKDSTIYLSRKYKKYLEFKNYFSSSNSISEFESVTSRSSLISKFNKSSE